LSVTGVVHLQLMRAERAIWGARLRGSIIPGGGRGEFFTSTLSVHRPCLLHFRFRAPRTPSSRVAFASSPRAPSPTIMAPPQSIIVIDPLPWPRSTVMAFALHELENAGQLAPNVDGQPPAWIVPPAGDREPNPPFVYVVSFVCFHEHGFAAPASRFQRGLCYHYGVELHNFATKRSRRWPRSSTCARDSWGSQQTGISRSTFSMRSYTRSPRRSRRCAARCVSAACRSRFGRCAGSSTSLAR
jgi:hypothetical protein